jgi:hypothetical protein
MTKQEEQDYRNLEAISYSDMKILYDSPRRFYGLKYGFGEEDIPVERKESTGFKMGDLVDCLVMYPDDFDSHFIYAPKDLKEPSSKQQEKFIELYDANNPIADCYAKSYTVKNLKADAIEKKGLDLFAELKPYLKFRDSVKGRRIVTTVDKKYADIIVSRLESESFSHSFFWGSRWDERFVQLVIKGKISGILFKCMLDVVCIDHAKRTVWVVDLKTIGRKMSDIDKVIQWFQYDEQLMFYTMMLSRYLEAKHKNIHWEDYEYRLVNVFAQTEPLYEVESVEYDGDYKNYAAEKVDRLIDRLKYHRDNNFWEKSMEAHQRGGMRLLKSPRSKWQD